MARSKRDDDFYFPIQSKKLHGYFPKPEFKTLTKSDRMVPCIPNPIAMDIADRMYRGTNPKRKMGKEYHRSLLMLAKRVCPYKTAKGGYPVEPTDPRKWIWQWRKE